LQSHQKTIAVNKDNSLFNGFEIQFQHQGNISSYIPGNIDVFPIRFVVIKPLVKDYEYIYSQNAGLLSTILYNRIIILINHGIKRLQKDAGNPVEQSLIDLSLLERMAKK
jgi:hypothetical protein